MSDSGDDDFLALRPSTRRAIDAAFLKLSRRAHQPSGAPALKNPHAGPEDDVSNKFRGIAEDGDAGTYEANDGAGVPLSLIPTGLQMLDLPPDDDEVINVFRNAATGWESRPGYRQTAESEGLDKDEGLTVSKADWRAVCAVLVGKGAAQDETPKRKATPRSTRGPRASGSKRTVEASSSSKRKWSEEPERRVTRGQARKQQQQQQPLEDDSGEAGGFLVGDDEDGSIGDSRDDGGGFLADSDEGGFVPESDEEDPDGTDSETYSDQLPDSSSESEFGASTRPQPSRSRRHAEEEDQVYDTWEDDMPRSLTARQLREAKIAFALFFPGMDIDDPALGTKRIGVKEIADAGRKLNEDLSANDIKEMLSLFSSGPSETIGIEEFGRMAVMARLI